MRTSTSTRAPWLVFCILAMALTIGLLARAQSQPFTTIRGVIGPGALYEIAMPTGEWNGELVVYAHGIVEPTAEVVLPDIGPLRTALTSQGFGLIYSSYSENGYAMKDGMQRTHQLRGIFASRVAQPRRVYLVGHSLGGFIALMLAERFPSQYDGALPACGLIGGNPVEVRYIGDARVLFDYFFPGVIPGPADRIPPDIDIGATLAAVQGALVGGLISSGQPTLQFAATAKLPGIDPTEIVTAGLSVLWFQMVFTNNLTDLANGHLPYGNIGTVYAGSANDTLLNAGVARYEAHPSALNYIAHYDTPTGDLRMPVVTLHTTRDPIVPFFHEQIYAQAVQHAGASQYLLQRQVDAFGHCTFSDTDFASAFLALVQWVHTGVKPDK